MLECGRFRNLLTESLVFETVTGVTSGHPQNLFRSCFFQRGCWVMAGDSVQDHGIVQVGIQKVGLRLKKNVYSAFEHSVKVHCAQFRRGSKIFKKGTKR